MNRHEQRICDELLKLPNGVLRAMYTAFEHIQDEDLVKLPVDDRYGAGVRMPIHVVPQTTLAAALVPCLYARDFFRRFAEVDPTIGEIEARANDCGRHGGTHPVSECPNAHERDTPDAECTVCGKPYFSADGHATVPICAACMRAGKVGVATRRPPGTRRKADPFLPADASTPEPPLGGQRPEGRVTVKRVK